MKYRKDTRKPIWFLTDRRVVTLALGRFWLPLWAEEILVYSLHQRKSSVGFSKPIDIKYIRKQNKISHRKNIISHNYRCIKWQNRKSVRQLCIFLQDNDAVSIQNIRGSQPLSRPKMANFNIFHKLISCWRNFNSWIKSSKFYCRWRTRWCVGVASHKSLPHVTLAGAQLIL